MHRRPEIKIYTRTGDKGKTSLIGGSRVHKYEDRIEAYGTVDELNSFVGMLRDQKECRKYKSNLQKIQECLFVVESLLAADSETSRKALPQLSPENVTFLEQCIDEMNLGMPPIRHFVLPGGHTAVSWAHLSRTVCRRAERIVIRLASAHPVDPLVISYINRLSDYFFVLARRLAFDLKATETPWITQKKSRP